jgi:hypothetical protein
MYESENKGDEKMRPSENFQVTKKNTLKLIR